MFFVELEDAFRQIAFGGIGNDGGYPLARSQAARNLHRHEHVGPGARSCQHPFHRGQLLYHVEGIAVGHGNDLVSQRAVKGLGDETGADTFDFVVALLAATEHRAFGLDCNRQRLADCVLSDSVPRR